MDGIPTADCPNEGDTVHGWSLVDSRGDFEDDDSCSTTSSVEVVPETHLPDVPPLGTGNGAGQQFQPMFVLRLSGNRDIVDSDDENLPSHTDTSGSQSFEQLSTTGTSSLQYDSTPSASIGSAKESVHLTPTRPVTIRSLAESVTSKSPSSPSGVSPGSPRLVPGCIAPSNMMSTSGQHVSQEHLERLVKAIDRVQSSLPEKGKRGVPLQHLDVSVSSLEMFGDGIVKDATSGYDMGKSVEQKTKVPRAETPAMLNPTTTSERPQHDVDHEDGLAQGGDLDNMESSVSSTFSFLDRDQGMEIDNLLANTDLAHREAQLNGDTDQDSLASTDEPLSPGAGHSQALSVQFRGPCPAQRPAMLRWEPAALIIALAVLAVFFLATVKFGFNDSHPMPGHIQQKKFDKLFDDLEDCKIEVKDHKVNYEWQGKQLDICRHRTLAVLEEQLKDTIDNYENILQNYRGQLSRATQENANLKDVQDQFNQTRRENQELRSEISTLKNVVSGQEQEMAKLETDMQAYEREMQQDLVELTAELARQNDTLFRRKNTIQKYREDLNQVRQENSDLRSEVMKLKYSGPNLNDDTGKGTPQKVATDAPPRCYLPPAQGPCEAATTLWYYNLSLSRCEAFVYGGCQGNENSFSTKQECDDICNKSSICMDKLGEMQTKWREDQQKLETALAQEDMWHNLYTAELGKSCDETAQHTEAPDNELNVSTCWRLLEGKFQERIQDLREFWPNDAMQVMFNYFRLTFGHGEPSADYSEPRRDSATDDRDEGAPSMGDNSDADVDGSHYNSDEPSSQSDSGSENQSESPGTESDDQTYTGSEDSQSEQTYTGQDENLSDFWTNVFSQTKESVFTAGDQLQNTWQKVRDVSENLWVEHKPGLQKLQNSFSKKIHDVTEKVQEKLNKKAQQWFGRKRKNRWEDDDERKQYQANDGEGADGDKTNTRRHSHHAGSKRRADSQSDGTTHGHGDHGHKDHHSNHHHGKRREKLFKQSRKCQNQFKKLKKYTDRFNMKKFRHMDNREQADHKRKLVEINEKFGLFLEPDMQRWLQCQLVWWSDVVAGVELSAIVMSPSCLGMLQCWQVRASHGAVSQCKRDSDSGIPDTNFCVPVPGQKVKFRQQTDDSKKGNSAGLNDNRKTADYKQGAREPDVNTADSDERSDWMFARAEEREFQRDTPDDWYFRRSGDTYRDDNDGEDGEDGDDDDGVLVDDYDDVYVHFHDDEFNDL